MDAGAIPTLQQAASPAPRRQEVSPEETHWIRSLLGRHRGGSAMEAARNLLDRGEYPRDLEPVLAALSRRSPGKWRERTLAAWLLGLSPIAPEQQDGCVSLLARTLIERGGVGWGANALRRALLVGLIPGGLVGAGLLATALLTLNPMLLFAAGLAAAIATCVFGFIFLLPAVAYSYVTDTNNENRVRAEAATALRRQRMLPGIGALAGAAHDSDSRVRSLSRAALLELLPMLTPERYGTLGSYTTPNLAGALLHLGLHEDELAAALVEAQGKVGDSRAIPAVELAGRRWRHREKVAAAVGRALPVLYDRREREKDSARLLRSAETPGGSLLRPAGQAAVSADFLLSSTEPSAEACETLQQRSS